MLKGVEEKTRAQPTRYFWFRWLVQFLWSHSCASLLWSYTSQEENFRNLQNSIKQSLLLLIEKYYKYYLPIDKRSICNQVEQEFLERGFRKLWAYLERFRRDFRPNQLVVYDVSYRRNISGLIHVYLCCGHTLFKNKIPETTRTLLINFEFYLLRVIWLWFLYWQTVHAGLSSLLRLFITPKISLHAFHWITKIQSLCDWRNQNLPLHQAVQKTDFYAYFNATILC